MTNQYDAGAGTRVTSRRAATASFVGGVVEFYDFFIYGTAAALILNDLFFPTFDPVVGTLVALTTFGLAYVVRPIGGVIFGHVGDRIGRKATLVATLFLMGVATFLIGCLPTYDTLGPWAAVALVVLRLAQGLAAGGELGGASALAVEHAPHGRRGFFGAFATAGTSGGVVLGSGVFALVTMLPDEQFATWGWRVPFLLSAVVVVVGLIVRRRVPEPEVAVVATSAGARLPVWTVLREQPKNVAISVAVFSAQVVTFYLVSVYSLTYARSVGPDVASTVLAALTVAGVVNIVAMLFWGAVSDRYGRRPVLLAGLLAQGVFLFVFFASLGTGSFGLILGAILLVLGLGQTVVVGIAPAFFAEMFPADVRCTGISLGMQLASVAGGFAPVLAAVLAAAGGGWVGVASVAAGLCVVAAVAVVLAAETSRTDLGATTTDGTVDRSVAGGGRG